MWIDFLTACQAGLTACCLYMLALLLAVCAALTLAPLIREKWAKLRKLRPLEKAVALVAVAVAIAYGGTKPVQNAGSDEGIALVSVAVEYDETNDVSAVEVKFTGYNVTTDTPVSVRNDQTENWRELEKIGATVTTDLVTNLLAFAVSGNVSTNKYWWVGTDTPAVIIESKGIEIIHFAASSSSVQIMWTCDDPNATAYTVQRRRKGEQAWQTVGVTSSLAFVYVGFTIGETWEWRVSSTYEATEVE
ncbi:MAG: hypothetical protein PUE68_10890 [Kiritimatiellae bacterium]|nr:hypothetical protein [Kiritimatiellia bacterium]